MQKCPRCEEMTMDDDKARNAYSRVAAAYICAACGEEEGQIQCGLVGLRGAALMRHRRMKVLAEQQAAEKQKGGAS